MEIPTIIEPTVSAAAKVIPSVRWDRVECLSVIGELIAGEEIEIQRPLVSDPDPDNDADWTCGKQDGVRVVLSDGHDWEVIPVSIIVRVKKPATTNEVGVSWS